LHKGNGALHLSNEALRRRNSALRKGKGAFRKCNGSLLRSNAQRQQAAPRQRSAWSRKSDFVAILVLPKAGSDRRPAADEVVAMHHEAHEQCFIASSVKTDVRCEPVLDVLEVTP